MVFDEKTYPLITTIEIYSEDELMTTKEHVYELPNRELGLKLVSDYAKLLSSLESSSDNEEDYINGLFDTAEKCGYEKVYVVYSEEVEAYNGPGDCVFYVVKKGDYVGLPGFETEDWPFYATGQFFDALKSLLQNVIDGETQKPLTNAV